jgi:hypothetical protein
MKVVNNAETADADRVGVDRLMEAGEELKRCWANPSPSEQCHIQSSFSFHSLPEKNWLPIQVISVEVQLSKGFVTFSLTIGPEYHISQVSL